VIIKYIGVEKKRRKGKGKVSRNEERRRILNMIYPNKEERFSTK